VKTSLSSKANILFFSCAVFLALLLSGCDNGLMEMYAGRGYSVSGTVSDASGNPLPGVEVMLIDAYGVEPVLSGSNGEYTILDVPPGSYEISAEEGGYYVYPEYNALTIDGKPDPLGSRLTVVTVKYSDRTGIDFTAVKTSDISIPIIQGKGARSPLEGQAVSGITGVVTKVTYKSYHFLYDTLLYDGSKAPQYVGEDGFYLQAMGSDVDGDPATSDAIFVNTHNPAYDDSKWLDTVPPGIREGDVVSVSGTVSEYLPVDRFGNSEGFLTVTRIVNPTVFHVLENGTPKTAALPAPVRLTNTAGFNSDTMRSLPWEEDGPQSLVNAVNLYESLEGMLVVVHEPLVVGGSYYNVAGILADNGEQDNVVNKDRTATGGIHINEGMDFNPEIIYVDYTGPTWKTFDPLCQQGDTLKSDSDANGDTTDNTLTGVIDYTENAIYWISPLLTTGYHNGFDFDKGVVSSEIDENNSQEAGDPRMAGYNTAANSTMYFAPFTSVLSTSSNGFTQNSTFLTVAEYNIENFENEGKPYDRDGYIAHNLVNNMGAPDIITLVEMGDQNDSSASVFYANQSNSYYVEDGCVSAVGNYKAIIQKIAAINPSLHYDFREIAPEDGKDGGKPGTNIRVAFLFNKDRVTFVDRGIPTNSIDTTTSSDESTYPVVYPSETAEHLARSSTDIIRDSSGAIRLTQSPGRLQDPIFNWSRKSLVGEFSFRGEQIFIIVNHFKSKRGDSTLYGTEQPPIMGSEYKRGRQAQVVNDFVDRILSYNSQANIIVAGDFNDFQFSPVMKKLSGEYSGGKVLWNLSEEYFAPEEQYTYSYKGNYQQLDHLYASKNLMDNHIPAGLADPVWIGHINSHFSMNNHIEFSDHDPIVAVFEMP